MAGDDDLSLRVIDLGKRYALGRARRRTSAKEVIQSAITRPFAFLRGTLQPEPEIWALRHASFEARPGDAIALLGPNGAGKSTLLKLLARVTRPTEGSFALRGRLCSLLEVGVGFHPELTGRDNVLLSGVIHGMSRREVASKFEEIVAFSGLEQRFLDTMVKHYSSGMYLRLGFAVAAHLDPDVLVVDESLAVGDVAFRAKCMDYMRSLRAAGVTVIIVSHDVKSIREVCSRALVLRDGAIAFDGPVERGIEEYEASTRTTEA